MQFVGIADVRPGLGRDLLDSSGIENARAAGDVGSKSSTQLNRAGAAFF